MAVCEEAAVKAGCPGPLPKEGANFQERVMVVYDFAWTTVEDRAGLYKKFWGLKEVDPEWWDGSMIAMAEVILKIRPSMPEPSPNGDYE